MTTGSSQKSKARRKPGRPSERDSADIRQRILAAARSVYGRQGYKNTTVELILEESNTSRTTFYRHFEGRYDIIDQLVSVEMEELLKRALKAVAQETEPVPRAKVAIQVYFDWCSEKGSIAPSIYSDAVTDDSPAAKHREHSVQSFVEFTHAQAVDLGREKLDPLIYDTLIHAVEHIGSKSFIRSDQSAAELERHKKIAERILSATLFEGDDFMIVPPLSDLTIN